MPVVNISILIKERRYLDYQDSTSKRGRIHVVTYTYDELNRIVKVSDTTGAELLYSYNSRNAVTSIKEKLAEGKFRELHFFCYEVTFVKS